jgi:tetratricopeptide (TPR) repeat protein
MRARFQWFLLIGIPLVCVIGVALYYLPPIHERLAWRIDNIKSQIIYAINPPEQAVFVPKEQVASIVRATLQALTPTSSPSSTATPTVPGPTSTPAPSPTPTLTPTPIPQSARLTGIIHEYQKWNNCGPANLSMALSYWGWKGDQRDTAAYLKPNERDKNVMPYEMETFVEEKTDLKAIVRVGGDLELLKRFIAAGFPVLVEKGFEVPGHGWMGHYEVLSGYDDVKSRLTAQDSYIMPDLPVPYDELEAFWRNFDDIYLVIYPPERETEVLAIFGPQTDEVYNYRYAAQKASDDIATLTGRDLYFAWYNRGTNLVKLQDYAGAAEAYDQAFTLYPTIPEKMRPWRMLWYQTGPYFAYFFTGRYQDVINLATETIIHSSEPAIEESFFWRARAKAALGDTASAVDDLRESLKWHPDFAPSVEELNALGAGVQ